MGNDEIKLIKVRSLIHNKCLRVRQMDRLVNTLSFNKAFYRSTEDDRKDLAEILDSLDVQGLKDWEAGIHDSGSDLSTMSYRKLRELCKQHNIYKWSRLERPQMIEALNEIYIRSGSTPAEPT